jgi:hypothetical protein
MVRRERPFSRTEFERRIRVGFQDQSFDIAAPEDVILAKLGWSKLGESERQWNDALQVARTQKGRLKLNYLKKWAGELGVSDFWGRIRELVYTKEQ